MSKIEIYRCDKCGVEIAGPITYKIRAEQVEKTCNIPIGEVRSEIKNRDFCEACIADIIKGLEENEPDKSILRNQIQVVQDQQVEKDAILQRSREDIQEQPKETVGLDDLSTEIEELDQEGKYPAKKKQYSRKIQPSQQEKISAYYKSGKSVQEIANRLGFNYSTVYNYLKKTGEYSTSKQQDETRKGYPGVEEVKQLYFAESKNIQQVATELQVPVDDVRRIIVANHLSKNTKEYQKYMATCSREDG